MLLTQPRRQRHLMKALAVFVASVVSWQLVEKLLATTQGLDFTDEGLTLAAAQSGGSAFWGTPYGSFTRLLWLTSGESVVNFRNLGAIVLLASSAALGFGVTRTFFRPFGSTPARVVFLGPAISLSSLLFYAGGMRTPGYNWLASVGSTLVATAIVREFEPRRSSRLLHGFSLSIGSLGLILTLFSRPPVALASLLALIVTLFVSQPTHRDAIRCIGLVFAATAALLGILSAVRVLPPNVWSRYASFTSAPAPLEAQTVRGALRFALTDVMFVISEYGAQLLLLTIVVLAVRVTSGRTIPRPQLTTALVVMQSIFALAISGGGVILRIFYSRPVTDFPTTFMRAREIEPLSLYLDLLQPLMLLGLLVVMAPAIYLLAVFQFTSSTNRIVVAIGAFVILITPKLLQNFPSNDGRNCYPATDCWLQNRNVGALLAAIVLACLILVILDIQNRQRARVTVVVCLATLILSMGFGSGDGPVSQLQHASHLVTAAAVVAISPFVRTHKKFHIVVGGLVFSVLSLIAASVVGTGQSAYGWDRTSATHAVQMPKGDYLYVHKDQAQAIDELRVAFAASDWQPGFDLLTLTDPWVPGIGWFIQANLPQTLMLTIGGYSTTNQMLIYNMRISQTPELLCPWIVVSSDGGLFRSSSEALETRASAAFVTSEWDLPQFPDRYRQVYESREALTWLRARHVIYKPLDC